MAEPRIVSRGELRNILAEHIAEPSHLTYYRLPQRISRSFYLALSEADRAWYEPDEASVELAKPSLERRDGRAVGVYHRFRLTPGSYDAWIVRAGEDE